MIQEDWTENQTNDEQSLKKIKQRTNKIAARIREASHILSTPEFDIQKFIEGLQIVNRQGKLVSLLMNRSQEIVFHRLLEARECGKPGRFICLKARQVGISTLIQAYIFALMTKSPNRFALMAANSVESASTIFGVTKRFCAGLKGNNVIIKPVITARKIEYPAPHCSKLRIDTAANRNLGRGGTLHYVHASEIAFWENPEEPILGINQAVPQHSDTLVFWESTANGMNNLFHRSWIEAQRGESDMEPIFLSWKDFPEYSLPVASGEKLDLDQEEEKYGDENGLSPGQVKWAGYVRRNQCRHSWEKFHQEYPIVPDVAFTFSGMPWFDQGVLLTMLDRAAKAPVIRGTMVQGENGRPEFIAQPDGVLEVWAQPQSGLTYSIGMDIGEGIGADYTVLHVLCNETCEVAATYRSNRIRPEDAGNDAFLIGAYYNYALLGIERNGPGSATLAVCERGTADLPNLSGYPNLYYHIHTDQRTLIETKRLGWITTRISKEAMLNRLARAVEERGILIRSPRTLLEMQGFIWDAERNTFRQNYRAPGSKLNHDDEIMAMAIANEMRLHCFRTRFILAGNIGAAF